MRRHWIFATIAASCALGATLLWIDDHRPSRPASIATTTAAADHAPELIRRSGPSATAAPRLAPETLLAREALAETFGRFDTWAATYLAEVDPAARIAALPAGLAAAAARREALRGLIPTDPGLALAHAVPWGVRAALPAEVLALLEDRVSGIGTFRALAALPLPAATAQSSTRRIVEIDGQTYEAYTYGRRLQLGSRTRLAVHGIAVDGRLALSDSPIRVLAPGEPVPAGRAVDEVCAISGRATVPATAAAAVDSGDRVIYLCSAGHIAPLAARLESAEYEGGQGGADANPAAAPDAPLAVGVRRVLMLRIRFADQPAWFTPETDASAEAMLAAADAFFRENSFDSLRVDGTVSPVYTLPQTAAWYSATDASGYALNVLLAARAVAADPASAPGNEGLPALNYLDYDLEAVRYTTGPGTFSGQGYVAMRGCWIKSPDPGVLIHELGHNLGLWHANAWAPTDPLVPLGSGTNIEYGDAFDTMGPARGGAWHFNTWEKRRLGWLTAGDIASISGPGASLALAAHDLGTVPTAGLPRALRIPRDSDRAYWIDFRRHPAWPAQRSGVHDGVTLRWSPWARSNGGSQLLDTTPGSPGGRDDATLALGRTFADPAAGIYITPVAVNTVGHPTITLDVRLGAFPGNRPPTVTVAASATAVSPGEPVQFSATASDPDGDALSFSWTFDDSGATTSGSVVSHTWSTAGDHRARVTVSDRRGGSASASLLVRTGPAAGSRIRGRILDLAGDPVPGVLVHNGTEPADDAYRAAWTDADGTFTLLEVPPGTWRLDASAPGWLFAVEGFSHPIVTPGDSGEVILRGHWKGFTISGTVRRADGAPLPGALVHLADRVEPTDAFGEFALTGLSPGRHVLSVESEASIFDPRSVELGSADVDDVYLREKTFTLSGTVTSATPATVSVTTGWQSTSVSCGGASSSPARFSLTGVPAGAWTVRAIAPGTSFTAGDTAFPLTVSSDRSGLGLVADPEPHYAVSGVVRDRGVGLAGATVSAGALSTTTDSRGGYWLPGLPPGSHEITVAAPGGLEFTPVSRTVQIASSHLTGIDFSTTRANLAPVITSAPHAVGPTAQPFITLAAAAADDDPDHLIRYWWSVIGAPPGDVAFATNGSHAAHTTVARFSAPGSYSIRITAVDPHGTAQSADCVLVVRGESGPPVITAPARADPPVIGSDLTTRLTIGASSTAGDGPLTFTWRVDPGAPGPVDFATNATPAARDTTARFRAPGNYLLRVTVRDSTGRAVESSVAVHVELTYASWLSGHFDPAVVGDPTLRASIWGELADPDGDGIANLLEYAFGGDPLTPSPDSRPRTHFLTEDGVEYLAVTFTPNPSAIDLAYEPQLSSDLESWQGGAVFVPGPDERTLTYRDFLPAAAHQRRFIRIQVSQPQP